MDSSILTSIKKLLGLSEEDTSFDQDIIMHINTVLNILAQLGVGPANGFSIEDDGAIWSDYLGETTNLELIKSYIYMKVRLMFDPPTSSILADAMNKNISELEWRINVTVDPKN
jgi:hypothetical protein